jgi:hypothetical protein
VLEGVRDVGDDHGNEMCMSKCKKTQDLERFEPYILFACISLESEGFDMGSL